MSEGFTAKKVIARQSPAEWVKQLEQAFWDILSHDAESPAEDWRKAQADHKEAWHVVTVLCSDSREDVKSSNNWLAHHWWDTKDSTPGSRSNDAVTGEQE